MSTNELTNEIEMTRTGGLGGSDAAMVYKIGLNGLTALNNSDKRRLAVMLGIVPYVPIFQTRAMRKGHDFEDFIFESKILNSLIEREKYLELRTNLNFKIFCHADFYNSFNKIVYECKYSKHTLEEVKQINYPQLQWYYLLNNQNVVLVHHPQISEFENFNIDKIQMLEIEKDDKTLEILWNGLKLINDYIKDFTYEEKEEWKEEDLLPFEQKEVNILYNYLTEIKRLENEVEERKQYLLEVMRNNNIKSITSDKYRITYIAPSEVKTLDKIKLFKEHPEINETDYLKTSKKKDYVKIDLLA